MNEAYYLGFHTPPDNFGCVLGGKVELLYEMPLDSHLVKHPGGGKAWIAENRFLSFSKPRFSCDDHATLACDYGNDAGYALKKGARVKASQAENRGTLREPELWYEVTESYGMPVFTVSDEDLIPAN